MDDGGEPDFVDLAIHARTPLVVSEEELGRRRGIGNRGSVGGCDKDAVAVDLDSVGGAWQECRAEMEPGGCRGAHGKVVVLYARRSQGECLAAHAQRNAGVFPHEGAGSGVLHVEPAFHREARGDFGIGSVPAGDLACVGKLEGRTNYTLRGNDGIDACGAVVAAGRRVPRVRLVHVPDAYVSGRRPDRAVGLARGRGGDCRILVG